MDYNSNGQWSSSGQDPFSSGDLPPFPAGGQGPTFGGSDFHDMGPEKPPKKPR